MMVQGIETDDKRIKKKRKKDIKYMAEDLNEIRKTTEKYIDSIRPKSDEEINKLHERKASKKMSIDRIFALILLGFFGSIALISGIYMLIIKNYVVGIPTTLFGVFFVVCYILFERYR